MRTTVLSLGACGLFAAGALSGLFVFSLANGCGGRSYQFVNADVACGKKDVIRKTGYIETRGSIEAFLAESESVGRITRAAVYFRDLERGPVFGINELEVFAPASLLKLPLAFVFLNSAETQPAVLEQKINFKGVTSVLEQRIAPEESAVSGQEYAIEELLRMMLVSSDNASYEVLEQFLHNVPQRLQLRLETFQELGLLDPKDRVEATITVRGYASLFRILYNASYLSVENSEKVLGWLALSEYKNGLVAGVPESVVVSHKFGERYYSDTEKELHDCGIIYYPGNPYLLCVMTRGTDWESLEHVTGTVSRMVYDEVDSRKL